MEEVNTTISKKQAYKNWEQFNICPEIINSLVANAFVKPTEVQSQSLVFLESHVDMIIAAKTGQGKTLTFAIPILDLIVKKLQKPGMEDEELKSIKAIIMSPTRELALQIKDHINAIIPIEYQEKIKVCPIVGGMSIQKQERLLSYEPSIIVATPGRLWELMDKNMNPYLMSELPLIDVLVLDEADRMIEDGHFKELNYILNFIYTKRVDYKRQKINKNRQKKDSELKDDEQTRQLKSKILSKEDNLLNNRFMIGKNLEGGKQKIDMSKVVDLVNEDQILDEINENDIEIEIENVKGEEEAQQKKTKKLSTKKQKELDEEEFKKAYHKLGGIQHIICSATLSIDNFGRVTPKKAKWLKKKGIKASDQIDTLQSLCKTLRFRSNNPKVIDLTEEQRMPDTLEEKAIKCKNDEKDLYLYYYLKQKQGESFVIFCNSIQTTKRVNSLLNFLKIKNNCLHSKMQQRQRIKNLDRFKVGVQKCESGVGSESSILVCTDVAARGLDVPNVANVIHYQCPFNAEIYIHRSGRTARIGKGGEAFAILGPEDEKNYKQICKTLNKNSDQVKMFEVSYVQLSKLESLVNTAKQFESAMYKQSKDKKAAHSLFNIAKQADIELDEDAKYEIEQKLGKDIFTNKSNDGEGARHKQKERSKVQQLKNKYDQLKQQEDLKKFSNSSFLTPEAASYLNEVIKSGQKKADQEVVYAGLHSEYAKIPKFKRKEKYTTRYKHRNTRKRARRHPK